jgi:hypothetical protein
MREGHFGYVLDNDNCRPTVNLILKYILHERTANPNA